MVVGGLEPPTVSLPQELQTWLLYQLSYTTPINMYYPKFRPYAEPNPAYDSWLFAQRAYSEPSLHLFALLKFRIPAAHSASINLPPSLGLTLLPSRLILCMSGPSRGRCGVRNLPCRLWLYLRFWCRLFPLLQLVGLFRCRFDSVQRTGLRPGCLHSSVISINAVAYLPGLHAARPSAFVEVVGFEPHVPNREQIYSLPHLTALPNLLIMSVYPDFSFCFGKTSGLHSRLEKCCL